MNWLSPIRQRWQSDILLALALLAITALLSLTPAIAEFNRRVADSYFRFHSGRPKPAVTLVSIDDASLQKLGRWPWSRSTLATLVRAIAAQKPSVIGIDVLLSEIQSPAQDAELSEALRSAGNVVLVDKIANFPDGARWVEPLPEFVGAAAAIGHGQAVLDADGVCRSFPPVELSLQGPRYAFAIEVSRFINPAIAEQFLARAGVPRSDGGEHVVVSKPLLLPIPFRKDPPATISAGDLIAGTAADQLRGKVVLVGFGAVEIGDRITTPVSRGLPTPGVEIHAQIVDAILSGTVLEPAPLRASALALLFTCILAVRMLRRWRGSRTLPVVVVLVLGAYGAGFVIFRFGNLIAPVGTLMSSLLLAPLLIYGFDLAIVEGSVSRQMRLLQSWLPNRPAGPDGKGADISWRLQVLGDLQKEMGLRFELYRTLLEATRDLVAVFDRNGVLLFANQAFTSAWSAEKSPSLTEVLRGISESKDAPLRQSGLLMEGEASLKRELYSVRLVPLPATSLTPGGGTLLNMTNLHLRVERDRAREEALGFVAHELRTPLVAIQGFAELMTRMPNASATAKAPETILRESRRLLALINSYLDVLRTDAGARPLRISQVPVAMLLHQVFDLLSPLAQASSIRLTAACEEHIAVNADEPLLAGAVLNLVSNAIKYGEAGSEVHVQVTISGAELQISVHNVGEPIRDIDSVFEPFVRGENEESRQRGWGLGLSLVKRIVEKHAGTIRVQSDVQSGTTFTIRLPGAAASVGVTSS